MFALSGSLPSALANSSWQGPPYASPDMMRHAYALPRTLVIRKDVRNGAFYIYHSRVKIPSRTRLSAAAALNFIPAEKAVNASLEGANAIAWRGWGFNWNYNINSYYPYYGYGYGGYNQPYYGYSYANYPYYNYYGYNYYYLPYYSYASYPYNYYYYGWQNWCGGW
jgi:hypothetical protein